MWVLSDSSLSQSHRSGSSMAHRPLRPFLTIPPGAAPPSNPSPSAHDPPLSPINLWADRRHPIHTPYTPASPYNASSSLSANRITLDVPARPASRAASAYEVDSSHMTFPEPQLYRSSSQRSTYRPSSINYAHRSTRSESVLSPDSLLTPTPTQYSISVSGESRPPSFENTPEVCISALLSHVHQPMPSRSRLGTCRLSFLT